MPQALSKQDRAMRATYQGWAGMHRAEALKATGQFYRAVLPTVPQAVCVRGQVLHAKGCTVQLTAHLGSVQWASTGRLA